MKHAISRNKSIRPPRKGVEQPTIVAGKPRQSTSASSVKPTAAKTVAVAVARNTKSKNAVSKKEKTASLPKSSYGKKVNSAADKTARTTAKIKTQAAAKKVVPKLADKVKPITKTAKITAIVRKNQPVKNGAAKAQSKIAVPFEKSAARKTTAKVSGVKTLKAIVLAKTGTPKNLPAKSKNSAAKVSRTKVEKSPKINIAVNKTKQTNSTVKKNSTAPKKIQPIITASKKPTVILPETKMTAQASNRKTSRVKTPILSEDKSTPKKVKTIEIKSLSSKKSSIKTDAPPKKIKAAAVLKREIEKPRTVSMKNKVAPNEKIIAAETVVEAVNLPLVKPRKKKVKPLGAAIFRGAKVRYDFQVFPVDGEFEDAAAIFIISRRVVDKTKRAHHRMVCIGQTASVLGELKKHRKGKCFKQFQANAISVLREEDEQKRLKIEADLKSAHIIPCPHS